MSAKSKKTTYKRRTGNKTISARSRDTHRSDATRGAAGPRDASSGISTVKVCVDSAGRVLVPAKMRKALAIQPGDAVNLRLRGDVLELRSIQDAVAEAQALVRKYVPSNKRLVDELIEERRQEAMNE